MIILNKIKNLIEIAYTRVFLKNDTWKQYFWCIEKMSENSERTLNYL